MRSRLVSSRRFAAAGLAGAAVLLSLQAGVASADSARKPVVLDTQTGIHDGQSGIVLQNAPLSRQPMVAAQPAATLPAYASQAQQPIIVAPYIDLGGGATAAGAAQRAVSRPATTGK